MRAAALVRPRTTADLSAALKICDGAKQKIVTQGGLTGCVQGATSDPDTVIVSLEKMNVIEAIDTIGHGYRAGWRHAAGAAGSGERARPDLSGRTRRAPPMHDRGQMRNKRRRNQRRPHRQRSGKRRGDE